MCQTEDGNNGWDFMHIHANGMKFRAYSGGVDIIDTGYGTEIADTNWHHIAVCKVANEYGIYLDGVQTAYTQDSSTDTFAAILVLGRLEYNTSSYFDGFMDEVRIIKSNIFTAAPNVGKTNTITVPTTAYTSDANTKLLLHMESLDVATNKPLTFVGTAQLDTAITKFGSASLLLDGDSDYVTVPDSADWVMGTGDWTVDCWVYYNSTSGYQEIFNYGADSGNTFMLRKNDDNKYYFNAVTATTIVGRYISTTAPTINTGTWYHLALVRYGASVKLYIDGTSHALTETTAVGNLGAGGGLFYIGVYNNGTEEWLNGYIDELRISKGIARWTSDFTPPTSEYSANNGYAYGIIL